MTKRNVMVGSFLGAALLCVGIVFAQKPPFQDVPGLHPDIAIAQRLCEQASQRIDSALRTHEWDLDGHAAKAKDLLDQASRELTLAEHSDIRNHK
jgi:hypothetical protein